jgi:hypothetical protein
MHHKTKIVLVVCLTVSILSGFIPILFTANVQAGSGGSTAYSGRLTLEFVESSGHSRDLKLIEAQVFSNIVGSLDQDGRFDLSSGFGHFSTS